MSDVETADRLSRRRAWLMPVLGLIFLAGQAIYALGPEDPDGLTDQLKVGAWLLWAVVLLFLLATGGTLFRSRKIRLLAEDEGTRSNRNRAYAVGFWLAVATAICIYALSAFDEIAPRESIHVILTAAIFGALVTFGLLEHRAHRLG